MGGDMLGFWVMVVLLGLLTVRFLLLPWWPD